MNVGIGTEAAPGHAVPFLGIFVSNSRYCVLAVHFICYRSRQSRITLCLIDVPIVNTVSAGNRNTTRSRMNLIFMYRRPILCTLHGAVDFLKFLRIAVVGGWGGGDATGT